MSEDPMKMAHHVQQRIEKLAYQMWEAAGRQVDKTMDYWLEAEREIRATMAAATERMMPSARKKPEEKAAAPETKAPGKKTPAKKTKGPKAGGTHGQNGGDDE